MKKFVVLTLFSGLLALSVREAGAACSGGGWHQSSSKPVAVAAQVQTSTVRDSDTRAEPVSFHARATESSRPSTSFDSQFEGVNSQLSLNESQWNDVANAKGNIRNRVAKLEKKQARAEEKLAQCTGDCEDESRDVSKANEALQSYDAKAAFGRELRSILTSRQWDLYNSASVSSAK